MRRFISTRPIIVILAFCLVACASPEGLDRVWAESSAAGIPSDLAPRGFYAAGKLQRVRRKDNGAERVALTDGEGLITAFLAPNTRVDYREHFGQEVAIKGRVLSQDEDDAPYVAVETLTRISNSRPSAKKKPRNRVETVSFDEEVTSGPLRFQAMEEPIPVGVPVGSGSTAVQGDLIMDGQILSGPSMGMMPGSMVGGTGVVGASAQCGGGCQGACATMSGPQCNAPACTVAPACGLPATCGPPGWLWIRGEYLIWWGDAMDIPPLVTQGSSANPATAGVLGAPGTSILYGDESILDTGRSGYRIEFGGWFGPRRCVGFEGEYFEVGTITDRFSASSDPNGNPVIARPFININPRDAQGNILPGTLDAELVSFPGVLAGTIVVDSSSLLRSAAGRLRFNLCCKQARRCENPCGGCAGCGMCGGYAPYAPYGPYGCHRPCGYPPFMKVDFTAGYRYANLDEGLRISEDLQSLTDPERIRLFDSFATRNDFHGGEVGTSFESGWNRWTLELLMRVALGGVHQEVVIDGETTITTFGAPAQTFEGGLLTQSTNIGTYSRSQFAAVPELAANLGLYLTPRLRWTVGYTFFYFSNVVRPGEQISLLVNPDFIPPLEGTPAGLRYPEFVFRTTDFWAHGLNTGLDFRW